MRLPILLLITILTAGCSGVNTFPNRVAQGETVAIAAGWKHQFSRDNITVSITPVDQDEIILPASHVRASIHSYPDPLSSLALSQRTGQNISPSSATYSTLSGHLTDQDPDWWQNVLFVDIPSDVPTGPADIRVTNPQDESTMTRVHIVAAAPDLGGTPDSFEAQHMGPMLDIHFMALERVDHYVVNFTGNEIPSAVQLDLAYADLTGHVVNPGGLVKNLTWQGIALPDGNAYRVLLTPVEAGGFRNLQELKFYVALVAGSAGSAQLSLVPGSLKAVDAQGNVIPELAVDLTLIRGVAGLQ